MDRVRLLRKAAGLISYLGSRDEAINDIQDTALGRPGAEERLVGKVESGDIPTGLLGLSDKKRKELKRKLFGLYLLNRFR